MEAKTGKVYDDQSKNSNKGEEKRVFHDFSLSGSVSRNRRQQIVKPDKTEKSQDEVEYKNEFSNDFEEDGNFSNFQLRSNSDLQKDRGTGVNRQSLHTDFYYRLEALNEKIKVFTEEFYSNKRDNERREQLALARERHRQYLERKK